MKNLLDWLRKPRKQAAPPDRKRLLLNWQYGVMFNATWAARESERKPLQTRDLDDIHSERASINRRCLNGRALTDLQELCLIESTIRWAFYRIGGGR